MQTSGDGKTKGRNRAEIQQVIERLLDPYDLWKSGENEWRSRCPFHDGDNPTAFRIRGSGWWRCFRCDEHGDLAKLVMRLEHVSYQQAREYIGNLPPAFTSMEGYELPPYEDRLKPKVPYEVLREADIVLYKRYCPQLLLDRGFDERSLHAFEIGYDFVRGKIIIPVRDVRHKIAGITLRLDFDTDEPKYWHDHFDKSLHLYGFHRYKNRHVRELYLVEGQLDAVRLFQLGLPAAAIMGSSISQAQVQLLVQYADCDRLVLMYDNDEAGQKATSHSIQLLSNTGFGPRLCAAVYSTKDPGELRHVEQIESIVPWWTVLFPPDRRH